MATESGSPTTCRLGTEGSNAQTVQAEVAERSTSTSTNNNLKANRTEEASEVAKTDNETRRTEGSLEMTKEQQQHEQQLLQSGRPTARR